MTDESLWAILVKAEIRKLAKRGVKFSKRLLRWAGVSANTLG